MLNDYVELLVSKVLLECKDLLILLGDKANVAPKGDKGIHGSVGAKGNRGE